MRLIFSKAKDSLSSVRTRLPACPSKERFAETAWPSELCGSAAALQARLQLQLQPAVPSKFPGKGRYPALSPGTLASPAVPLPRAILPLCGLGAGFDGTSCLKAALPSNPSGRRQRHFQT